METSQPLAIESFSYSWLMNKKPSFDGLDEPLRTSLDWLTNRKTSIDEATSGETKSEMVMSKRFLEEAHNFNFDIPISSSPAAFVHADEIFSDGQIIPVYVDPSKIEVFRTSNSVPAIPISSLSSRSIVCPADRSHCHFLRKWRKSSKRILQKCFGCIRPLCRNAGCSRKSIKIDDIDSKVWEVKSWSNSPQTSPGQSEAYSSTDDRCDIKSKGKRIAGLDRTLRKVKSWSNSPQASPRLSPSYSTGDWNDVESSIYEAILHCKKSFASELWVEEFVPVWLLRKKKKNKQAFKIVKMVKRLRMKTAKVANATSHDCF